MKKLELKQKELICYWIDDIERLESEIAELEKQPKYGMEDSQKSERKLIITDADIEAWLELVSEKQQYAFRLGLKKGAKAMRDNEIKHVEK
jgi:hypothetical protein